jgi:hypothetical protein
MGVKFGRLVVKVQVFDVDDMKYYQSFVEPYVYDPDPFTACFLPQPYIRGALRLGDGWLLAPKVVYYDGEDLNPHLDGVLRHMADCVEVFTDMAHRIFPEEYLEMVLRRDSLRASGYIERTDWKDA